MCPWKTEDGKRENRFAFEHLRFSPEREEFNELLNGLGLEPLIQHRLKSGADGDLDCDGDVDLGDLGFLLARYGEPCS